MTGATKLVTGYQANLGSFTLIFGIGILECLWEVLSVFKPMSSHFWPVRLTECNLSFTHLETKMVKISCLISFPVSWLFGF